MKLVKKDILELITGDEISGVNDLFSALESVFYFRFGNKCFPQKNFIGCPNLTLVWALKASRLIVNGSYAEREILIYGSDFSIVFTVNSRDVLKMNFIQNEVSKFVYTANYLSVLKVFLAAAEKTVSIAKEYKCQTMAESVIENEIKLMKKHIEKYKYSKT